MYTFVMLCFGSFATSPISIPMPCCFNYTQVSCHCLSMVVFCFMVVVSLVSSLSRYSILVVLIDPDQNRNWLNFVLSRMGSEELYGKPKRLYGQKPIGLCPADLLGTIVAPCGFHSRVYTAVQMDGVWQWRAVARVHCAHNLCWPHRIRVSHSPITSLLSHRTWWLAFGMWVT